MASRGGGGATALAGTDLKNPVELVGWSVEPSIASTWGARNDQRCTECGSEKWGHHKTISAAMLISQRCKRAADGRGLVQK